MEEKKIVNYQPTGTNTVNYHCPSCGRTWQQTYGQTIKDGVIYLERVVEQESPRDDLCTCGQIGEGSLETPMPGYRRVRLRHLMKLDE
jgi:hypothetical protein